MKTLNLLPHRYKMIGWLLFIPSLILGVLYLIFSEQFESLQLSIPVLYNSGFFFDKGQTGFFKMTMINWLPNLIGILIIIGGLLIGFSKEKQEDEFVSSLRLKAVFQSLAISYLLVLLLFLTIFGLAFLYVMITLIYLPLILYILLLQIYLYHAK